MISYDVYWIVIILSFLAMRYNEKKGHWPLMKPKAVPAELTQMESETSSQNEGVLARGKGDTEAPSTTVKTVEA